MRRPQAKVLILSLLNAPVKRIDEERSVLPAPLSYTSVRLFFSGAYSEYPVNRTEA